jgi:hypothetical protein
MHLSFEILPPWWGTVWFRLAAVAAACALLAAAWNYRMHSLSVHKRELERQLQERQVLLERATRDALTGLWNRTAILEILAREIESAGQFSTPLAVVLIDVDHFKRINDTYGHLCDDAVLRCCAFSARRYPRESASPTRSDASGAKSSCWWCPVRPSNGPSCRWSVCVAPSLRSRFPTMVWSST